MIDLEFFRDAFKAQDYGLILGHLATALAEDRYTFIHHPLGFLMAEILSDKTATLRLHYWKHELKDRGSAITPYHDHIWRLSSCVVSGAIENCVLDVKPDSGGEFFLTDVYQTGSVDNVESSGQRVRFQISKSSVVQTGEFYFLAPRIFHFSSLVEDTDALTIVLSEPEITGSPRTLMPIVASGHAPTRREVSNSSEIQNEVEKIIQLKLMDR